VAALRDFEVRVLHLLTNGVLSRELLARLERAPQPLRYDYTGGGYFLTLGDPALPAERRVLDQPNVVGTQGGTRCGFVVFLRDHELTLECHEYGGDDPVAPDFRDREVTISVEPVNLVDSR
jgi:hypothetical protein